MTMRQSYSYTVLRYVHDVVSGEFINVGVVLHIAANKIVISRTRTSIGRLREVFPSLNRHAFVAVMRSIKTSLDRLANDRELLASSDCSASMIAKSALVADDSSLQWSPAGGGLTSDPIATFERLYERMVSRYDMQQKARRSDDDVWRPIRQLLDARHLTQHLTEKSIVGPVDDITFKHAWKNGVWHVYEPVSFDLADGEGIRTKAREWLGHISAVTAGGQAEHFKPYFIVGAPSRPNLIPDFEQAKLILRRVPNGAEIFDEAQADQLVNEIEDEIRAHEAGPMTVVQRTVF